MRSLLLFSLVTLFSPLFAQAEELNLSSYHFSPLTAENMREGILGYFEQQAEVRGLIAEHVRAGRLPKSEIENFKEVPAIEFLQVRELKMRRFQHATNSIASALSFVDVPMISASSVLEVGIEGKPVQTFKCGLELMLGSKSAVYNDCHSESERLETFAVSFSAMKVAEEKSM